MVDQNGRWFPDYLGQQPYQDPAYYRGMRQNVPPQWQQQPQYNNQQYNHTNAPVQGNFIRVPSEEVARNWNVQPGMSVTFIDENAPYCYTKTVDISQLDRPRFEKYRLVKEEETPAQTQEGNTTRKEEKNEYVPVAEFNKLYNEFVALKHRVDALETKEVSDNGESAD